MAAMTLDAGALSARLELEAPADVPDGQGGVVAGFAAVASVWARIEPVSVRAEEAVDEKRFTVTHAITVRHRGDLLAGMRFRKGGRSFLVTAVHDPDGTGRYLVCRCAEDGR